MADVFWTGAAGNLPQITDIDTTTTPVVDGATGVVVVAGVSIRYTAQAGDDQTSKLVLAFQQAPEPVLNDINASVSPAGHLRLTSRQNLGVPFEVSAGTANYTATTVQVATGPNFADNLDNYSTQALPAAADNLIFDSGSASVLYGLDALTGIVLDEVRVRGFTGGFGLPKFNSLGYHEYRDRKFQVSATKFVFDSAMTHAVLDLEGTSPEIDVLSAITTSGDEPTILLSNLTAANLNVLEGSVGVGYYEDDTADLTTLTVSGGEVIAGPGASSIGDVTQSAGRVISQADFGALDLKSGNFQAVNSATNTGDQTIRGGQLLWNTDGAWTGNRVIAGNGIVDLGGRVDDVAIAGTLEICGNDARFIDRNRRTSTVTFNLTGGARTEQVERGDGNSVTFARI